MKLIFFGTPDYVLPICEALHKSFNSFRSQDFIAVATQPPKPVGRKKTVERSAVDKWAFKHKLEIIYDLNNLPEFDLGVCASYGKIIPARVIEDAKFGILNIHPSLLPQFRGSSPLQATILTNTQPAVTIIKMDELMDHGPVVSSFKSEFAENETTETLRTRLFEESAEFLTNLIPPYVDGKAKPQIQDESKVTLTKIITKEDGFIPRKQKYRLRLEIKFPPKLFTSANRRIY
jgi:methionyl-tRNA formyltransferase